MNFIIGCIVLSLLCGVNSQRLSIGSCPTPAVQQGFDVTQYTGEWYEQQRFFAAFQIFSDCVTANYTLKEDMSVIVNNTGINRFNKRWDTEIGEANGQVPGEPAKLGVRFSASAPVGAYWVLSTDYASYTVVWSCTDLGILNMQYAWVLTRTPDGIASSKMEELHRMMEGYKIKTQHFRKTNQKNCYDR